MLDDPGVVDGRDKSMQEREADVSLGRRLYRNSADVLEEQPSEVKYAGAREQMPGVTAGAALRLRRARHTMQAEFSTTQARVLHRSAVRR